MGGGGKTQYTRKVLSGFNYGACFCRLHRHSPTVLRRLGDAFHARSRRWTQWYRGSVVFLDVIPSKLDECWVYIVLPGWFAVPPALCVAAHSGRHNTISLSERVSRIDFKGYTGPQPYQVVIATRKDSPPRKEL